ncbi:MAG TPA: tail fiber domain-containing protein [Anaerolineae bacterium]|nr:tail fiber domain-containing protein [Anaerolineae bacterium]
MNTASDTFATVGGGYGNTASGGNATVAGGQNNAANGLNSMILGGTNNTVTGTNSMAGGYNALANGDGCFAWGDHSTSNVIDCQGNNLWSIRATGGFYFRPSSTVLCSLIDASGWQCIPVSDRNAKQDFVSVNPRQVLNQVVGLPIEQWAYTDDATHIQHIGPMAQDFYAAFNVGADDKHINPVDSIGVALAAIQGLYQENQDLKGQNASLETRLTNLEQNAQPVPFNWINLLGVIAFAGFLSNWIQQRRTTRGQS